MEVKKFCSNSRYPKKPTERLSARASPLACAPTIPPSARQVYFETPINLKARPCLMASGLRFLTPSQAAAASREGAGFRQPFKASRCPKPRRGEAVAPAPVGVRKAQGVSRRRSASRLLALAYPGANLPPQGA